MGFITEFLNRFKTKDFFMPFGLGAIFSLFVFLIVEILTHDGVLNVLLILMIISVLMSIYEFVHLHIWNKRRKKMWKDYEKDHPEYFNPDNF